MATKVKINQIDTDLRDGWIACNATWTYASASTITVPSGAASIYQKGDRIKWTQTTVKYGVIVAVADTLLTIAVNTDYTVANAAITLNYYSHQANPLGYPGWFAYTPTLGYDGGSFASTVINKARYNVIGNMCSLHVSFSGTTSGAAGQNISFTLPITAANSANGNTPTGACWVTDTASVGGVLYFSNNTYLARRYDAANYGNGSRVINAQSTYEF